MIALLMRGHAFRFELENICRLFFPQERVVVAAHEADMPPDGVKAYTFAEPERLRCRLEADGFAEEAVFEGGEDAPPGLSWDYRETRLCAMLYELFARLTGRDSDWGTVTGVRPVKLLRQLRETMGDAAASAYLRERMLVSGHKLALCERTLAVEDRVLALSRQDSYSLYVSIPFCPTRCAYCSFVSHTVERAVKLIPEYLLLLERELAATGALARELGLRLETVYIGGGTPTTLDAGQMARLLDAIGRHFDVGAPSVREFTVEAGRPDTVTPEVLRVMKDAGVTRVSVNPQTLRDDVLERVGRRHTAAQFYAAFEMAREAGFAHINADVIAGLPGDDVKGFAFTLEKLLALSPESVTVHALSLKRAAALDKVGDFAAREMVAHAARELEAAGLRPYYLYRQSRTAGNQENTGWARPGYEGLYNVFMMDETHTVLGCGAGGVSKLKRYGTNYLERIFNYKFPYEYVRDFDKCLRGKGQVRVFYEQHGGTHAPAAIDGE